MKTSIPPLRLKRGAVTALPPTVARLDATAVLVRVRGYHVPVTPNLREHWATRANRAKSQRAIGACCARLCFATGELALTFPLEVTFVRHGIACDDDNLAGAFKSIRDGIAEYLGVDDRNTRASATTTEAYRFRYEQGPSKRSGQGFDVIFRVGGGR